MMVLVLESRELARHLLACEGYAGEEPESADLALLRVYEKLRQRLCALAGVAGFQSLAFRALAQAKSEAPGLWTVEVAADGSLQGLGEAEPPLGIDNDSPGEGGVVFIARLLGLLLIFIGEALTLTLISDLWPDATLDEFSSENGRTA